MGKATQYIAAGALGIIMAVIATASRAATTENACKVYKLDIRGELAQRGYVFAPETCHAESEGEAGFKFTVTVGGVKEVIHCTPEACG